MKNKMHVDGQSISLQLVNDQDYISLTDMAKIRPNSQPGVTIQSWLRNSNTLLFIQTWERLNNPNFNLSRMAMFRLDATDNRNSITTKKLIEETDAIGLRSKPGRYGGTYAHRDIAFEFGSWLSPEFKMYLITEFQRLKSDEYQRQQLEWDYARYLSKVNYDFQTRAIKDNILPRLSPKDQIFVYADEADLLNLVVFGQTARQWREENPDVKGNIRDSASIEQLTVLSNLESHNSDLIRVGASKEARYLRLCEIAQFQFEALAEREDRQLLE